MKVVQINTTCAKGSTGKISADISGLLTEKNVENYILYSLGSSSYSLGIKYSDEKYIKLQALKSRAFGNYGFNSKKATAKLINQLKRIQPDIVHLHNIHSHDCNLTQLFKYFKENKIKLVWTFHDCWAFTGYCTHFTATACDKWKSGCASCPQKGSFSWFFDKSSELFQRKKRLFSGLDLTIVTPSQWLADLTRQSFLKDYPIKVINNGIDLSVFKPTENEFRNKYQLTDKNVLLGVAFKWDKNKGLDVFIELSKRLDKNYQIVLVGTDDSIDKLLPDNIISIHKTHNQARLTEIYFAADVFVNPTREENFPTVNIEALACGTPVITFDTGGSPEIIDSSCGSVIDVDDIDSLESEIVKICEKKPYSKTDCIKRAFLFDKKARFEEYIELYEDIYGQASTN